MIRFLIRHLAVFDSTRNRLVEPFVGGGAVFFALNPKRALLADVNPELIDLYRGVRRYPRDVWKIFRSYASTKRAYYKIRDMTHKDLDLRTRAARTLYLNRTCFKGMWRHNSTGDFNVGYGGQDRRWVVTKGALIEISKKLWRVSLRCSDFDEIISRCDGDDFIYADPPYRPSEREMTHEHYRFGRFSFAEHKRLAKALKRASARGGRWALTTSSHPDIISLFGKCRIIPIPRGTGRRIGTLASKSGEVLICNYREAAR